MLAKIHSGTTIGLESLLVEVEVDVASQGLPSITIVGLASKAVDEARQRVRSALKNSSAKFPSRRITINLAPADIPKEGPVYDMPIAVGLLLASGQIQTDLHNKFFFGELSLDGTFRHTKGALPLTLLAHHKKINQVYLPASNAAEASIVSGVTVYPVHNLRELATHLAGGSLIPAQCLSNVLDLVTATEAEFDFEDIKGQEHAKRALEIAASGGHNVFMSGSPGGGKTMMARAFAGILPTLTESEVVEVTKIYSITGNISPEQTIVSQRPFRNPHHTTSRIGLIGGGSKPMPGEISLAHRGVLFLDEFPEFPRTVIESLRQPMEDGLVNISRASGTMRYPAQFILIAAANPCPCGNYGSESRECHCLPGYIQRYQKKISGPILDRIDLHVQVSEVDLQKLSSLEKGESSATIRKRVQTARDIQKERYADTRYTCNGELSTKALRTYCLLESPAKQLLLKAAMKMNLSARSYNKVIKIARTIADLDGEEKIKENYVLEAIQYRQKEEDI
jgi:magnesium chelatase family protein